MHERSKRHAHTKGEGNKNKGGKAEAGFRTGSIEKSEGGDHGQQGRRGGGTKQSVRGLLVFLEKLLTSCRACARCVDHGYTCVLQVSGSGKACQPCTTQKTACSFTGRMVPSGSVDPEVIKEAIESAVGPMMMKVMSALCSQKRAIEEMSMELFRKNMGHLQEDREWAKVEEALKNWRNWGKLGTGYGHLLVVEEKLLRRVDSPEASGSKEISEAKLLEVKRTRREVLGERVVDDSEDEDMGDENEGDSKGGDEDEIEEGNEGEDGPEVSSEEDQLEEDS